VHTHQDSQESINAGNGIRNTNQINKDLGTLTGGRLSTTSNLHLETAHGKLVS
jgi:hypothetical protein